MGHHSCAACAVVQLSYPTLVLLQNMVLDRSAFAPSVESRASFRSFQCRLATREYQEWSMR